MASVGGRILSRMSDPFPIQRLIALDGPFAVCRLPADAVLHDWATRGPFFSVTRTADELSVVCREVDVPDDVRCERGWVCFRVAGAMPFTAVGILAGLTVPLATAGVGVFAVSTFDTDYLLVKASDRERTVDAWRAAGHRVKPAE